MGNDLRFKNLMAGSLAFMVLWAWHDVIKGWIDRHYPKNINALFAYAVFITALTLLFFSIEIKEADLHETCRKEELVK